MPDSTLLRSRTWILALFMLLFVPMAAQANVFVFKLIPYPGGVPVITLQGPGGTVPGKIDTGAGVSIAVVGDSAIGAMGMDPATGSPSSYGGVGSASGHTGVDVPPSVGPATPPITPPGQSDSTPDLPDEGETIGGSGTGRVLIGSEWLNGFHYGRVQGEECDYFFLADKAMGREGLSEGVAIANFFANPEPPPSPDTPRLAERPAARQGRGRAVQPVVKPIAIPRPPGTVGVVVNPSPPAGLPADVMPFEGGWEMALEVSGGDAGAQLVGVPFLLKSGFATTLISQQIAETLGLAIDSLPTIVVDTELGVLTVPSVTLTLRLFADPSFPKLTVIAGILEDKNNATGWSFLGSDVFDQLSYWELSSVEPDGLTRFYAAP